ncbi:DEAD-box ATP-dependent RNA helicase (macronuclear) [Tetrahymena thermophila SB210]|uniref:ATP-dependent RNA helicase n=1 Tax=Tetrahymena thermophila (strain SB210) TaxID=312017 RepID=I7LW78_TETTS|nr:DEAD-box ATP-dependent RNA helicase [Tetrahymena thermophila SB210]EAS01115.2 DEAD-box ATP-dependent RNA helicase [Tetrahymena thermophila SB210]|eukprot:XP_001021360.2 DEAD-box ATP-dependent RNA helicase [Tetrahymena thermophila SB210]
MNTLKQKWEDLETRLFPQVEKCVKDALGYETMMPVQKATIPLFIKNHDLAVEAQTGSGKTLAFLLPIFNVLIKQVKTANKNCVYALVIAPTRELAKQIHEIAVQLASHLENNQFSIQLCIGGVSTKIDVSNIQSQGANILIATPGKLKELMDMKELEDSLIFRNLEILIMDEADRLMDTEYYEDMTYALEKLPKQRRTGLFSATLSSAKLSELIKYGLRNPVKVSVKPGGEKANNTNYVVPSTLENSYLILDNRFQKIAFMLNFILKYPEEKTILFLNTCASVDFYQKIFKMYSLIKKIQITSVHGQMKQVKRNKIIENFTKSQKGVLICTDVVARGIDFQDVHHILQIDPPQDPSFYIHRIGRTARKGKSGKAIILIEKHEEAFVEFLRIKNVEIQEYNNSEQIECDPLKFEEDIKKIMIQDRDNIEKSKKAFISYIRSYMEHDLKYIFEFKDLDIGWVARSFFLLRLPRIKEILSKHIKNFHQSEIDPDTIPFQDKNQEQQFSLKQEERTQKRQEREEHAEKQQKQLEKKQKEKNMRQVRRKQKREVLEEEQDEFSLELNLAKKLKQGKITLQEYKKRMKEIDPEDLHDVEFTKKQIVSISGHKKKKK